MDEQRAGILVELQKLDSEIDSLRLDRERSPILQELRRAEEDVDRLDRKSAEISNSLRSLMNAQSKLEGELGALETKIDSIEEQLYGGQIRATRELVGMQQELEHLKSAKKSVESNLLEKMIQYEETSSAFSTHKKELEELVTRLESLRSRWNLEAASYDDRITSLAKRRDEVASSLDAEVLEAYERLRSHLGGVAVATLEGARCTGCNVDLSKAALEEIGAEKPDIPRCENCGRMIVVFRHQ